MSLAKIKPNKKNPQKTPNNQARGYIAYFRNIGPYPH